nr:hypothetical protein [Nanoarchaeota archaeon]
NKPFSCIKMKYGQSNAILPNLNWKVRSIVWLDYDYTLNNSILKDIRQVFSSVKVGSVVIITVDANIKDEFGKEVEEGKMLEALKANVGPGKVPVDISENGLNGWNIAKIFKRIISSEIKKTVTDKNGGQPDGNKFIYNQLYNFCYDDGTRMLTVGGILYDEKTSKLFAQCCFNELKFIRTSNDPYNIIVPKLTLQEVKLLNKSLPGKFHKDSGFILEKYRLDYKKIYQFFPHFFETEVY